MWAFLVFMFWSVAVPIGLMGLAYLGGRLLAPDVAEIDAGQGDQSRSWNPFTTQQEGLPRPRAYGKNMHEGNIIAKWTDVVDNAEVLYMIIEHGDGPTKGIGSNPVYINDQPSGNFSGVTIQERLGTMDQTCMTGFEKLKLEYNQNNIELVYGEAPIVVTTPNDFFDDLEYTLCFPNGLVYYRKDGDRADIGTTIKVRIRPVGGAWTEIYNDTISGETHNPLFYKFTVSDYFAIVYGTQYELEFSRLNAQYNSRAIQNVHLRSVREVVNTAFKYPGKAIIGIKAVATSRLSGNIKVKIVREDRLINVYNGSAWSIQYSRNRAWVVWDNLTQPVISGSDPYTIERYEGIDPSRLDLPFFYEWAEWSSQQVLDGYGSTEDLCACDIKVMAQTDVFSLAYDIAEAGRVRLYWQGHKLTGWIDKAVTDNIDLVTMDTMMARTWKNEWAIEKELAGVVEVFYRDAKMGYERTSVKFTNTNAGSYKNSISVEGIGITTHGTAVHLANFLLERNRLIRNTNSFMAHKDAFRYKLGRVIKLQCELSDWGHGYRTVACTANNKITLDRDAGDEISPGDLLDIRVYDTITQAVCLDTYTVESVEGAVVTIVETWTVTPSAGCRVAVAAADVLKLRRIIAIDPTVDNYFKVTVETYDADLFDADELDPNNPNANYIWPAPAGQLNGPLTRAEITDLITQLLPPQPDIEIPWPSNLTWTGSGGDTVAWSATDGDDPITFRYRGNTYEITADSTTDEFVYWDPNYTTTFRHTNLLSTVLAAGGWLMCRNVDGVAYPSVPMQTIHGGLIQAGTITAAMIIVSGINALSLENGPAEAGANVTGTHMAASISGQGALATKSSVDLDNYVVDGTIYKRMLAAWRAAADVTKIDGGKIYTNSILAASINTYNLTAVNAVFENLIVQTAYIANSATKIYTTDQDASEDWSAATWHDVCSCGFTSLGGVCEVRFQTTVSGTLEGVDQRVRVRYEDSATLWELEISPSNQGFFSATLFHTPSSGSRTYKLQMKSDGFDTFNLAGSFLSVTEDKGK